MADPVATLKGAGVAVPDDLKIKVVENTASEVYMVLPDYPSDDELERVADGGLSDAELERVAAGVYRAEPCWKASGK
jgi:hypothetical protein